jgi:hypothetical protein
MDAEDSIKMQQKYTRFACRALMSRQNKIKRPGSGAISSF